LAALITLAPTPARADTKTWSAADGLWSDPTNWSPVGLPTAADDPFLTPGTNAAVLVTYDDSVPPTNTAARNLTLDAVAPGSLITLNQTANSLTLNSEIIANTGSSVLQISGSALHSVTGSAGLTLGSNAGSSGQLLLSGGSLNVATITNVGWRGSSGVTQTGGTLTTRDITIGFTSGALGTYTLADGALLCSNNCNIGPTSRPGHLRLRPGRP
jgi:hypothetical protein